MFWTFSNSLLWTVGSDDNDESIVNLGSRGCCWSALKVVVSYLQDIIERNHLDPYSKLMLCRKPRKTSKGSCMSSDRLAQSLIFRNLQLSCGLWDQVKVIWIVTWSSVVGDLAHSRGVEIRWFLRSFSI